MTYTEILRLAADARRHAVNLENWVKQKITPQDDLEFVAACIQQYDLDSLKSIRPTMSKTAIRSEAQRLKLSNYWSAPVTDLLDTLKLMPESSYYEPPK